MARSPRSTTPDPTTETETPDMTVTPDPTTDTTPADAPTPVDAFLSAHGTWASDPAADPAPVLSAYRAIPGGARAAAARRAMSAAMRSGADPDRVADLDDVLSAPTPSAARATVDPVDQFAARVAALQLAQLVLAADIVGSSVDVDAVNAAADVILSTPDLSSPVLAAAGRAVAAVTRGGSGARHSVDRDLSSVPNLSASYRGTVATVADGTVTLPDGTSHASLSAAGRAVNGGTAVNGWAVWTSGGRTLGARYDASDWDGIDA